MRTQKSGKKDPNPTKYLYTSTRSLIQRETLSEEKRMEKYVGKRVSITVAGWEGRAGVVTSVGNEVLPIHVTLDGEDWETDFTADEVEVRS